MGVTPKPPIDPPQPAGPATSHGGLVLDADVRAALLRITRRHHCERGAWVLSRTQRAQRHWLLEAGRVALGSAREGRLEHQSRDVGPGEWIDPISPWLGPRQTYLEDAVALQPSAVLSIPHRGVRQLGLEHPELLAEWAALLARRSRDLIAKEFSLSRLSMLARFSAWLLAQAAPDGPDGPIRVVLKQPKRAIASQLGATPETLSRVLRQLVEAGLVRARGQEVSIIDQERLRSLASGS